MSLWSKNGFSQNKKTEMASYLKNFAFNWREDQNDSFGMLFNSPRQLLTALGQLFKFFLYTGHMMSLDTLVTPVTSFLVRNEKQLGILDIMYRSKI